MNYIDEKYRSTLAEALGLTSAQISLFWKGRVGFYGLLKALGVGPGDEVIIPAFTCVVVPNAILYLGAVPIYADVESETYNMAVDSVKRHISSKTKVIVAQNTFGLSADLEKLATLANGAGIRLVEDCTHGFGGFYQERPNGTIADAAFFSTQWNKPFSSGLGGIVACRDQALALSMRDWEKQLPAPAFLKRLSLGVQILARKYLLTPGLYWTLLKIYRYLSQKGWVTGSSSGAELDSAQMPADYLTGMGAVQKRTGLKALENWPENYAHRLKIAAIYSDCLKKLGYPAISVPEYASHTFIKYPVLVRDRDYIFRKAEEAKIPLGDWMLSPIHPIQSNFEEWCYPYGENPTAEFLSAHVINLQTDLGISVSLARKCCDFLTREQEQLIRTNAMDY
ncbi:MAG: aminotransferase class I/II-fold pyridoxal phosphate-dependent enzyme [Saprospiraceae bacterium]|nr:aminotransferase class I/II-fold pyridoxal phosphate-dependent enzyme [Saprospiraceae bacterium]